MGNIGLAMSLIFSLAGIAIVGGIVFASTAHRFLVVLEQTAAGNNEVNWPDEPYVDHLWKAFYLGWLTTLWIAPGFVLSVILAAPGSWLQLLLPGVVFWLFFPLSLLSSLSAASRLIVLRGELVRRLLDQPAALGGCYLVSGVLLAGACWLLYLAVGRLAALLPLAALVAIVFAMIYARLWGWLAWLTVKVDRKARPRPSLAKLPIAGASQEKPEFTLIEEEESIRQPEEEPYALRDDESIAPPDHQERPVSSLARASADKGGSQAKHSDRSAPIDLFNVGWYFDNLKTSLWLWLGLTLVLFLVRNVWDKWPS